MKIKRDKIADELAKVKRRGGKLLPSDVVAAAADKASPIHGRFEWDDTKAGHQYRLWQARELIASVEVQYAQNDGMVGPVYVSLQMDRNAKGGYRSINDVLQNKELRSEMLRTALAELNALKERFRILSELAAVFESVAKVEKRLSRRGKAA